MVKLLNFGHVSTTLPLLPIAKCVTFGYHGNDLATKLLEILIFTKNLSI